MGNALLQQGLDLTLFGMGVVFSFLLLLVLGTLLMSWVITRFFPEPVAPVAPLTGEARTRAIIQAAIEQHRKRKGR